MESFPDIQCLLFGNRQHRSRNRCVAYGVLALLGAIWLVSVAAIGQAESYRQSQAPDESDSDFAPERVRPLSAHSAVGYSRFKSPRGRNFDAVRPIRPPVNTSPEDRDQELTREPNREFERPAAVEDTSERDQSAPVARPSRRLPRNVSGTSSQSSASNSETPSLVADDGGPVAELLLHYSVTSEAELGAIYRDLFEQLGQNVSLQVCCPNEQSVEAFSARWGAAAKGKGRTVHVVNVNRPITVWARDRRICRQTPDGQLATCFVPTAHATYDPEKQNDLVLTSLLWSTGLVPGVALTSLHLEGGNVVSNRRHVFVGANVLEDNEHRFESEESLFGELSRLFGRQTIAIRGQDGGVPWIHTDMYLTPVDSKTILVASPVLGCDLLPNRKTITAVNRGKQVAVDFDSVSTGSVRQQRFDDVAAQLTELGYQVIRMPALVNTHKDWMLTYNNVIMDYQDGQRVVYMPVYNVPELDEAATQTYRALGFEVKPIDVSAIFQLGGAIRCLANVTRRFPFEARLQPQVAESEGRLQVFSVDPSANRVREVRPSREKRPLSSPSLERRQEQSDREYSASGQSYFGQSSRRQPYRDREQPYHEDSAREPIEQPAPSRLRPSYNRSDVSGRRPVDSEF